MQGKIKYTFHINETESILFVVNENNIKAIYYDSFAMSYLLQGTKKIALTRDTIHYSCQILSIFLKQALKNKLLFNEKKVSDIGFLSNEVNYEERILAEEKSTDKNPNRYCLWSPVIKISNIETWLYNNARGEIILFMAPIYPFYFCTRRGKNYLPYPQWIKTYQPVAKYIIPKKVAQQWLKQANEIMELIKTNANRNEHGIVVQRPTHGQEALGESVAFKASSTARVSAACGEFSIFTKNKEKVFNGYVVKWDDLELAMQDALQDAGLVTQAGKFICKN
jgi:hypothetical protein